MANAFFQSSIMIKGTPQSSNSDALNKNELRAVSSVIPFVAHTFNASEETITTLLTTAFNVESVQDIPHRRYEDAIRFLIDLRFKEVIN